METACVNNDSIRVNVRDNENENIDRSWKEEKIVECYNRACSEGTRYLK